MYVQLADIRLFFDMEGPGLVPDGPVMRERPTLVCLHGGPDLDHSSMRPAFSALAEVAQVLFVDQRGHGRSGRSEPARWSLAQWADDIRQLCEQLGIERPVLLGSSFGGYVAMVYALRHPGHLGKLVLLSTAARGTGNPARQQAVFAAFERLGGTAAREAARRAFDERTPAAFEEYLRLCGPLYSRRPPDPEAGKRKRPSNGVMAHFEGPGSEGVTFDLTEQLSQIRCPVLVAGGEDDPITPITEQRLIAEHVPRDLVRFAAFPGCGHGIVRDNREPLLRIIAEFVVE